jgi:hypothetical protein
MDLIGTPDAPVGIRIDCELSDTRWMPVQPLLHLAAAIDARASDASYNQPPEVCEALLATASTLRNHIEAYAVSKTGSDG